MTDHGAGRVRSAEVVPVKCHAFGEKRAPERQTRERRTGQRRWVHDGEQHRRPTVRGQLQRGFESHTVGCFVNSIPVRMRMRVTSDETTMRLTPWLQSIQRASARRQRYEWVSARQIRSWCNLAAAAPLFDVLVVLNPTTPDAV